MPEVPAYELSSEGALRQGEILSNVTEIRPHFIGLADVSQIQAITPVQHAFAIVLSQDCDLDWDHKARTSEERETNKPREIPSILLAQAVTAEELRGQAGINSKLWSYIRTNKNERYQFLSHVPEACDSDGQGLPELGLDFKRFFSLPTEFLYFQIEINSVRRRTKLRSPYVEHLSHRFASYLSRIALPTDHESE